MMEWGDENDGMENEYRMMKMGKSTNQEIR